LEKVRGDAQLEGSRFGSWVKTPQCSLSARVRPNFGVEHAAPGNYRTRCSVDGFARIFFFLIAGPVHLTRVETFAGAAC
jgi:hypothetical protein